MSRLDIDAAQWVRLSGLLDEALDCEPAARAAWIDSLGSEFEFLKPQLRDLLSRNGSIETRDFLGTLPNILVGPAELRVGLAGEIVGAYRLVRELGAGGMGSVWLAERTDGLIQRNVALKLPHRVIARRAELGERMAREREILATLDHRNIARLFDAGITPEGQPFLALEYVEGLPIDEYCRGDATRPPLDLHARLALFRQVADAVAYAHGKLVVHRDLKPANILVTANGGVRLLDFGIAKLLDQGQTRETQLTEASGRALTPDYASPEQILGEPLTVASDVYSLGVILYELLTDERPYRLKRDSRGALEDAIVQAEPKRPSEAAAARRRELRGDLDTITLKALKKRPQDRYATVHTLADDITRHLQDRPVLARPDSRWYRLRKFVARNKLGVGAAAIVLLAVIAGAGVAVWQARTAIAERDRAEEVKRFITSIFRDADPYHGGAGQLTGAELLRTAQQRIETQFAGRPEIRIELLTLVGASLKSLSDLANAEKALNQAVAEATRIHGPDQLPTVRARVLLADVYNARRDTDKLAAEIAAVMPLARACSDEDIEPLVRLSIYRGDLGIETGKYAEAVTAATEAMELARRSLGDTHALSVQASTLRAEAMHFKVTATGSLDAVNDSERALAFALAAYPEQPDHPQVLYTRNVYGRALSEAGLHHQALEVKQRALAGLRAALGDDNVVVANAEMDLAGTERRIGRLREALERADRAITVLQRHVLPDSRDWAAALVSYGVHLVSARRPREAEAKLAQAQQIFTTLIGEKSSNAVSARLNRLVALAYLGRRNEVQAELAAFDDPQLRARMPRWAGNYPLAVTRRLIGEPQAALALHQESFADIKPGPKADSQRVSIYAETGFSEFDLGRLDAAQAALDEAQRLSSILKSGMSPQRAETVATLGRIQLVRREPGRALPLLEEAHAFWQDFDASNPLARDTAHWLGEAYVAVGRGAEGRALLALPPGTWR